MSDLEKVEFEEYTFTPGSELERAYKAWKERYYSMTEEERERERVDSAVKSFNDMVSDIDDCDTCHGTRDIAIPDYANGTIAIRACHCKAKYDSLRRMELSGLDKLLQRHTFENYKNKGKHCELLVSKAKTYLSDSGSADWLVMLGQSGSGKTHICTAVCGEFLKQGKSVRYLRWLNEGRKLLNLRKDDGDKFYEMLHDFQTCDVLYIDDLFKRDMKEREVGQNVSTAELRLALELLNFRLDTNRRTIISGEDDGEDLCKIDQALGGRIIMQAGIYIAQIAKDEKKNYRLNADTSSLTTYRPSVSHADRSQPRED